MENVQEYEAPVVETIIEAAELEREVLYAGSLTATT